MYFQALGALSASGPLASRAFIPLFIVSAMANEQIQRFLHLPEKLCLDLPESLTWLGSDWFVGTVAVFAIIEVLADKNDDLKEITEHAAILVKTGVSVLIALAILPKEAVNTLPSQFQQAGFELTFKAMVVVGTAGLTAYLAWLRAEAFSKWREWDEEDDLSLRTVLSFIEDIWALAAIPALLFIPPLTICMVILLFGFAALFKFIMYRLEQDSRRPCTACGEPMLPPAVRCPKCKAARPPQRLLTWAVMFGRSIDNPEDPIANDAKHQHMLRLLAARRCPACAEKIKPQTFAEKGCGKCGFTFEEPGFETWYKEYRVAVINRAFRLLVPLMLISWAPVLGVAVAIVSIKLWISSPLRVFLGRTSRFALKWGLRLITLIIILAGSLPLVSIVAVPVLMCIHITAYGLLAKRSIARQFARREAATA